MSGRFDLLEHSGRFHFQKDGRRRCRLATCALESVPPGGEKVPPGVCSSFGAPEIEVENLREVRRSVVGGGIDHEYFSGRSLNAARTGLYST